MAEPVRPKPGNRIEAQCRELGIRLTGQRKLITEVLSETRDHLNAAELHELALKRDQTVSLATVYRTVKRLEAVGILERHAFLDGRSRYEAASLEHHDHLIDLSTGKIVEFRSEEIEQLQAEIAERLGYKLVGRRLELYVEPAQSE